jgi:multidrug transporter EmrE-like cation transporter
MWDVISSVLVSAIGLYYFKEKLSHTRILGVLVSFVAIYLLSYDEN